MALLAKKFAKQNTDNSKRLTPLDMISSDEDSNGHIKVIKEIKDITTDQYGKIIKIEPMILPKLKVLQPNVKVKDPEPVTF